MPSRDPATDDAIRGLRDERERLRRAHLEGLGGLALVRSMAAAVDAAVTAFWGSASNGTRVALVAVGGYGRGELSPHSDIDLMVLHGGSPGVREVAEPLFYALWDVGLQVGHATRTIRDCARLGAANIEAETSFLDARLVAGDHELFEAFREEMLRRTRRRGRRFLDALADATAGRHAAAGHASWLLEPNLKEGAGGLRDLHTVSWLLRVFEDCPDPEAAEKAGALDPAEAGALTEAAEMLHRLRNHLHYLSGRRTDVLGLAEQEPSARFLGYREGEELAVDGLMRDLYRRARAVEHVAASLLSEMRARAGRRGRSRPLGEGIRLEAGRVVLDGPPPLAEAPELPARAYAAAAQAGVPLAREAERWVREALASLEGPLPPTPEVRAAFLALLAAGRPEALEAFDHVGAMTRHLPEWEPVRCRPQHNVYHRFTVDVHAFQTVGELVALAGDGADDELARRVHGDVRDRDGLLLAGLLHDVGKGAPGDHSVAGERIALAACDRLGIGGGRRERIAWLVRHHLLLADTATRRDTGDENLVVETAETVGDAERLRMLYLLTVADSRATGPEAWTPWKAALVGELFTKVLHVLERGELTSRDASELFAHRARELREALARHPPESVEAHLKGMSRAYFLSFPTTALIRHFALMAEPVPAGEVRLHVARTGEHGVWELTIVAPDRPGLFSVVSGALAVNGIDVVAAQVFTRADGAALEILRVVGALDPVIDDARWERVRADVRRGLADRDALESRIVAKRETYAGRARRGRREPPRVVVDNAASDFYTLVEVHAPDRIGLLYAITRALADLGLDIHLAKVATYGDDVVDVFYVRDLEGQRIEDPERIRAIERSVLERIRRIPTAGSGAGSGAAR